MVFRILSLDGGGIRGAYTASVIQALERVTWRRMSDHFDLIVGTSTGGILAMGLALGHSGQDLTEFYRSHGPKIFPAKEGFFDRFRDLRQIYTTKLSQENLRSSVSEIVGTNTLSDAKNRLVIPAYDAVEGVPHLFKTAHSKRKPRDIHLPVVDIALATAAAPTYYDAAKIRSRIGSQYIDGGIWANNPILVGITEAIHYLGVELNEIDVLSIGTLSAKIDVSAHKASGVAQWNKKLLEVIMQSQADATLRQAKLLLNGRVLRIDKTVKAGDFQLDDGRSDSIDKLIGLGDTHARRTNIVDSVEERFLNGNPAKPFNSLF